jgi:hypothetical protein
MGKTLKTKRAVARKINLPCKVGQAVGNGVVDEMGKISLSGKPRGTPAGPAILNPVSAGLPPRGFG